MKKLATILMLVLVLLLSTSCFNKNKQPDNPIEQPGVPSEPGFNEDGSIVYVDMKDGDYDKIDEMHSEVGNKINISVITESRGVILNANYAVDGNKVSYTVEKLNMLPSDGDINKLPESMSTIYSGTAHVNEKGELVDDADGAVVLPEGTSLLGNMNFSQENFKDGKRSPYGFEGSVASVKGFLGFEVDVNDMKVKVDYTDAGISSIILTYTKGEAKVTITYKF